MTSPYPANPQPELARERNRIAADRSLLSFVRNSLTLISIGFGLDQVIQAISPREPRTNSVVHILSLVLVGLGVFNLIFAARDYQDELKRLNQPEYFFTPRWSLGRVMGIALLLIGLATFTWIISKVL